MSNGYDPNQSGFLNVLGGYAPILVEVRISNDSLVKIGITLLLISILSAVLLKAL